MLLSVVGALTFASCGEGGGHEENHDADTTAVEHTSDAEVEVEEGKELAEHVCSDKCTPEACNFACGEKGHSCSEACHKAHDEATEGENTEEASTEETHEEASH